MFTSPMSSKIFFIRVLLGIGFFSLQSVFHPLLLLLVQEVEPLMIRI
jgi:hypothetical protein